MWKYSIFFKSGLWNKKKKMLKIVYQHRWSNVLHVHRYITKMYIFGPYIPVKGYYWHYDFVWFGVFPYIQRKLFVIKCPLSVIMYDYHKNVLIIMTNILSTDSSKHFSKHFHNGFFKLIQAVSNDSEQFWAISSVLKRSQASLNRFCIATVWF